MKRDMKQEILKALIAENQKSVLVVIPFGLHNQVTFKGILVHSAEEEGDKFFLEPDRAHVEIPRFDIFVDDVHSINLHRETPFYRTEIVLSPGCSHH